MIELIQESTEKQRAEHKLKMIHQLLNSEGYQQVLKPLVDAEMKRLREQILNGECTSYEQYLALCHALKFLENILVKDMEKLLRLNINTLNK